MTSRLTRAAQMLEDGKPLLTIMRETGLTSAQVRYVEKNGPPERNDAPLKPGPKAATTVAGKRQEGRFQHALMDWIDHD